MKTTADYLLDQLADIENNTNPNHYPPMQDIRYWMARFSGLHQMTQRAIFIAKQLIKERQEEKP